MKRVVISASSDIGASLAARWLERGFSTIGTFRRESAGVRRLRELGAELFSLDLLDPAKDWGPVLAASAGWTVLVIGAGTTEPIGPFEGCDFDEWRRSIESNFIGQAEAIWRFLPSRSRTAQVSIVLFAGGGTNGAPPNYSAYTVSKIALIKLTELLAAELPEAKISIVGPGWVKTKIHFETIDAGAAAAGDNFEKTQEMLSSGQMTPMEKVLDCCDWLIDSGLRVSGRNFSVVYDDWGSPELDAELDQNSSMYKLRRFGNDWKS